MKFVLFLLLIGCGKNGLLDVLYKKGSPKKKKSDQAFIKYINKFNSYSYKKSEVPIVFDEIKGNSVGVCTKWSNGYREIGIDKEYWHSISEGQKEQLIFHELGHCVLDKDHNNNTIIFSGVICPTSVMRSYAFNSYEINNCYNYDYNHYIKDLF